jgi:hypothetical protein
MDVDYYMKMYRNFGPVKILDEFLLVNRVSPERLTNNLSESEKLSDLEKLTKRYA